MSCAPAATRTVASDGRVWDMTGLGEGLRNTIAAARACGPRPRGFLHWSGNFDEVQDFETADPPAWPAAPAC
jgi:hypothetical protein